MTRRLTVLLAVPLLLLAAACGTTDDADDTTTTTTEASDERTTAATTDDGDIEVDRPSTTGDDDPSTTEGDDTPTSGREPVDEADADFCEAVEDLDTLFDDLGENDYPAFVDTVNEADEVFDAYLEGLPDDLRDDGELVVGAVRDLADEIDTFKNDPDVVAKAEAAFEEYVTPDVVTAGDTTDEYADEACPGS